MFAWSGFAFGACVPNGTQGYTCATQGEAFQKYSSSGCATFLVSSTSYVWRNAPPNDWQNCYINADGGRRYSSWPTGQNCSDQPEGQDHFNTQEPAATCINGCEFEATTGSCETRNNVDMCVFETSPSGEVCSAPNPTDPDGLPDNCIRNESTGQVSCDCSVDPTQAWCQDPNNPDPPDNCITNVETGVRVCAIPDPGDGTPGDSGQPGTPGNPGSGGDGGDGGTCENGVCNGGDGGDGGEGGEGGQGGQAGNGGQGGKGGDAGKDAKDYTDLLTQIRDALEGDEAAATAAKSANDAKVTDAETANDTAKADAIKKGGNSNFMPNSDDEGFHTQLENKATSVGNDIGSILSIGGSCPSYTFKAGAFFSESIDIQKIADIVQPLMTFFLWLSVAVQGYFIFFKWGLS